MILDLRERICSTKKGHATYQVTSSYLDVSRILWSDPDPPHCVTRSTDEILLRHNPPECYPFVQISHTLERLLGANFIAEKHDAFLHG